MDNRQRTRQRKHTALDIQHEKLRRWYSDSSNWGVILEDYEFTDCMVFVPNVYKEYISTSVEVVSASCNGAPGTDMKAAVQTFFESPVVRAAFGEFKSQCNSTGVAGFFESELVDILGASAANLDRLNIESQFPRKSWPSKGDMGHGQEKLKQLVNDYILRIESWRCQGLSHGRAWSFGTQESMLKFLTSTLVQFWHMDQQGCFSFREVRTNCKDWNVLWDNWVEKCNKADAANSIAKPVSA